MAKKIIALFVSLLLCAAVFAQSAPKKVLSGKDVDMFVRNFDKIDADLDALGDTYDDLFGGEETSSPAALSAVIHESKIPEEVQSIFRKHGLGDNGFEKIMVISLGFSLLEMDDLMRQQESANPDAAVYMADTRKQMADMKAAIHKDDFALIDSRRDQIRPVLTDE